MSIIILILSPVFLLILLGTVFILANRSNMPEFGELTVENPQHSRIGKSISVTTWNIGYAGLGAKADFIVDGGSHFRALKKDDVSRAVNNITLAMAELESDVIIIQENAEASFLTFGISLRKRIEEKLRSYSACFWSDFNTKFTPVILKIRNGMSGLAKIAISECILRPLPQERAFYFGMFKKHYAAMVQYFPITDSRAKWVVINIHLAAFDKLADVRSEQIDALFEMAQQEYEKGNFVVIGGDWNLKISRKEFPHKTAKKNLFWIFDFPKEKLPENWSFATDEQTPTVRTLHKPYVAGENYTMIVDGFAVSPNVEINKVHTKNFQFEFTDHHPVTGIFMAKEAGQ